MRQTARACDSTAVVKIGTLPEMVRLLKKTPVQLASMSALSAWVLRKARQDYEEEGELSGVASISAWMLYLLHLWLTVSASLISSKRLPANRDLAATLGVTSVVFGAGLFVAGVREFRSFEQMSGLETGQLVKSGPYRYSRNPQIVGWLFTLLGFALAGRSVKALVLVSFFFLVHRLYFPIEERHLERTFGEEYLRYRAEVSRFLGLAGAG